MRLKFTKMQGAGNDFVVLDATRAPIELSTEQLRRLGDRRFGVGADQILLVEPARDADADFRYRIFNNTGDEVEHCGNGARCFVRFVHERGLTTKRTVTVDTVNNRLRLHLHFLLPECGLAQSPRPDRLRPRAETHVRPYG